MEAAESLIDWALANHADWMANDRDLAVAQYWKIIDRFQEFRTANPTGEKPC